MPPMPPPTLKKKPAVQIAIGIPKPGAKDDGPMPPPGMPDEPDDPAAPPDDAGGAGAKHSTEEAHVVREGHNCSDCLNWDATSGECAKVEGTFEGSDLCIRYFEPGGSGAEPDDDDQGGPPDQDADDEGAA